MCPIGLLVPKHWALVPKQLLLLMMVLVPKHWALVPKQHLTILMAVDPIQPERVLTMCPIDLLVPKHRALVPKQLLTTTDSRR